MSNIVKYASDNYGDFYWEIRYTDTRTGERVSYMNVAFPSRESAQRELYSIKTQIEKMKGMGYYLNRHSEHEVNYAFTIGKNFRISKRKFNSIKHNI